jgi:hypothetical protein
MKFELNEVTISYVKLGLIISNKGITQGMVN